jgi:hypothetical protein
MQPGINSFKDLETNQKQEPSISELRDKILALEAFINKFSVHNIASLSQPDINKVISSLYSTNPNKLEQAIPYSLEKKIQAKMLSDQTDIYLLDQKKAQVILELLQKYPKSILDLIVKKLSQSTSPDKPS